MSATTSPTTGAAYGVDRVCRLADVSRSSFYAQRRRELLRETGELPAPKKRGPKTELSDDELLGLIRSDLEGSPFTGEGHRKVWARLRYGEQQLRVSRKRVLRLMRENQLLSPRRSRQGEAQKHDGTIVTAAPNDMWGTDGTRVFTAEQGWVWIFVAVEHWNAECVGWHVAKEGTRFAALEPIAQGLARHFGSQQADVARGLSLRMDNGPQYLSDHFQNQVKFWGITTSFAFVEQPQTNGVAERFFKTLKEQAIYGRVFRDAGELEEAVARFVALYNREWRVEKNGFLSPLEARQRVMARVAA